MLITVENALLWVLVSRLGWMFPLLCFIGMGQRGFELEASGIGPINISHRIISDYVLLPMKFRSISPIQSN